MSVLLRPRVSAELSDERLFLLEEGLAELTPDDGAALLAMVIKLRTEHEELRKADACGAARDAIYSAQSNLENALASLRRRG